MDTTTIHTSPTMTPTGRTRDRLAPTVLVVVFTTLITAWFNLSEADAAAAGGTRRRPVGGFSVGPPAG